MIKRILEKSRFVVIIGVITAFLFSLAIMLYAGVTGIREIISLIPNPSPDYESVKKSAVEFIVIIDAILISIVLYIVALGLYELFIDDNLNLPAWLDFHSLDDLKERIVSVVIVILSVTFLTYVVNWDHSSSTIALGLGIAAVICALTYFIKSTMAHSRSRITGEAKERNE